MTASATSVTFTCDSHPNESFDPLSSHSLAALTDMHIAATVRAVADSTAVREAWAQGRELSVHGWVYHVATAKLQDLDIGLKGPNGMPADDLGSRPSSTCGSSRNSIHSASGSDNDDD